MMWNRRCASALPALLCTSMVLSTTSADAAGYYAFEIGPRSVGRAGANLVNPGDPSALWTNPAAITNVRGLQLKLDGALVNLSGSFRRDCGPNDDCGPQPVTREYAGGRRYEVTSDRAAADDENGPVYTPKAGNLGRLNTPSDFSDGHAANNRADWQPIPGIWAVLNLDTFGIDGAALGFAAYAPYAGDYAFGSDEFTRYSLIDRDLLELYYQATFAYRFQNWIAVGASLQGASAGVRQRVKLSADPYGNENPDYDLAVEINTLQNFIPSANFGLWSNPLPGLELGGSLQLGRSVSAPGSIRILNKGPEIEAFIDSGALTLTEENATATTSFELPAFWRLGAKYGMQNLGDAGIDFEIEGDFVYEQWSSYDHVFIETAGIDFAFGGSEAAPLDPIVQPRDWQDAWSLRLGGELGLFDQMVALRGGVMYETAAVPTSSLNIELLNGEKVGMGLGASVRMWGATLDFGYGHMFVFDRVVGDESIIYAENPVRSLNPEPRTRVAMGKYTMSYDVVTVGLTFAFDEMFGWQTQAKPETEAPQTL